MSRRWYAGFTLMALAILVGIALWRPALEVEVVAVDRGPVRPTVTEEGRTRVRDLFVVSAPVSARLLRLTVEPGDRVNAGEPIARLVGLSSGFLDPRLAAEAREALAAAEARHAAALVERDTLAAQFQRLDRLTAARLVATADWDLARGRWQMAEAAVRAAAADERRARRALVGAGQDGGEAPIVVRAPAAGVVLTVMQESESPVAAGMPLVSLGDPARSEVTVDVLSEEAVQIRVGDQAVIDNWGGRSSETRPLAASVERIEPIARTKVSALGIEEQRTRIVLRFREPIPEPLQAEGYRVDARIIVDEVDNVPRIPLGALVRMGEVWRVYVVRDGRARIQSVRLGLRDEHFCEIREGLQPGEPVVVFPSTEVRDGRRVRVKR